MPSMILLPSESHRWTPSAFTITRLPARLSEPMSENGWRWCAASSARYSALVRCAGAALAYSGAT
ncbi:Uncharacterised protein [Burkholderia pseudomallei]|nr:Uncharacterised protein [Burkholderia pseudomallei]CAJ4540538.1 Uncharacterised protein [Burkholderia pseudomallei]CAJ5191418.1 Uncharacterised protein [Burkholderia pseudomallei]CAJ5192207.1 Uncharacterised protein [Burkholderia pseudomallei]CAJ5203673.1 Uncharacterised protein [Burkholderia pseudomallei]